MSTVLPTVLFLDSGIGGIPYFSHFRRRNPRRGVAYLADRQNFPYGGRDREELAGILVNLVGRLTQSFESCPGSGPGACIVLACNSATIAALSVLRERFPWLTFVGTVPAVKPAAIASGTGKIGVLGTGLTVRESYVRELAARHGSREIIGIAAPELVEFVENGLDSATDEEKRERVRHYLGRFREKGADVVVLGCTHFLFLLEDFRREAAPDIAVFESVQGVSRRVESLLPPEDCGGGNLLLLTGGGAPGASWKLWAERLDCRIALLGES